MKKNARFWIYRNEGWVKICLVPEQSIEVRSGGPCDEGFCYRADVYRLTEDEYGQIVESEHHEYSRDCDGPSEYHWEGFARLDDLHIQEVDGETFLRPSWRKVNASQRDIYAEMAGY